MKNQISIIYRFSLCSEAFFSSVVRTLFVVLSTTEKLGCLAGVGYWLAGMAEIRMQCLSSPFSMPSY
tara:strand:- start:1346 stop:1546 length:201 start_codon:yes stop_codon:yes gene_type:complete